MKNLFKWFLGGDRQVDGGLQLGPVRVFYKRYEKRIDVSGQNLILLAGGRAHRDAVKKEIPVLVELNEMEERGVSEEDAKAWTIDEVADEIHEFNRAYSGASRLRRILFRDGHLIEMMFG